MLDLQIDILEDFRRGLTRVAKEGISEFDYGGSFLVQIWLEDPWEHFDRFVHDLKDVLADAQSGDGLIDDARDASETDGEGDGVEYKTCQISDCELFINHKLPSKVKDNENKGVSKDSRDEEHYAIIKMLLLASVVQGIQQPLVIPALHLLVRKGSHYSDVPEHLSRQGRGESHLV